MKNWELSFQISLNPIFFKISNLSVGLFLRLFINSPMIKKEMKIVGKIKIVDVRIKKTKLESGVFWFLK